MKKKLSAAVNVALAAVVVYYVAVQLDVSSLRHTLSTADLPLLLLAFAAYALNYALRAARFHYLLKRTHAPYLGHLAATQLHGTINYLLPARLGELSYPWLAHRTVGISVADAALALIIARVSDLFMVAIAVALAVIFYGSSMPTWLSQSLSLFVGVGVVTAVMTWGLARSTRSPIMLCHLPLIARHVHRAQGAFQAMCVDIALPRQIALTAFIWMATLTNFYLITHALGFHATVGHVLLVSALALPLSILPVHGIANIGAHEFAWTLTFQLLGDDHQTALAAAVGTHVILFTMVLILGISGLVLGHVARHASQCNGSLKNQSEEGSTDCGSE